MISQWEKSHLKKGLQWNLRNITTFLTGAIT
jgi:hypothetical protein